MIAMEAKRSHSDTARAIFLSVESGEATAERFNVSVSVVYAIWRRARWSHATRSLKAPARPLGRRKPAPVPPEIELFVRQNCDELTLLQMAFALRMGRDRMRAICKTLGVTCRKGWSNHAADDAENDYAPAPLPPGEKLTAPPGTRERIELLRSRVERKVELWDAENTLRLPRCLAKIETLLENVS